jgi:Phosphotransferase system IIB components
MTTNDAEEVKSGTVIAVAAVKAVTKAATKSVKKTGGKYDQLAADIVKNVGGVENINSLIHCITRLRFYLKDDSKANDQVIENLKALLQLLKPAVNIKLLSAKQ